MLITVDVLFLSDDGTGQGDVEPGRHGNDKNGVGVG